MGKLPTPRTAFRLNHHKQQSSTVHMPAQASIRAASLEPIDALRTE
jgi:hypothetical protein